MNNPIPQCATDSPEWAFRAVEMINELATSVDRLEADLDALRDALRDAMRDDFDI